MKEIRGLFALRVALRVALRQVSGCVREQNNLFGCLLAAWQQCAAFFDFNVANSTEGTYWYPTVKTQKFQPP